jgi:endonuclease-3 related protein
MKNNCLENLYRELKIKYGRPQGQWKLWCKRPKSEKEREEVILGAILTQRTNWNNVQMAIDNLKKANIISLEDACRADKNRFTGLIKPSGFYKTKAGYLLCLARYVINNYGNLERMKAQNTKALKEELLELKGIGPETADSILLYALDKPVFVIDEYTRRLVRKKKLAQNLSYDFLQKLFEGNLKKDFRYRARRNRARWKTGQGLTALYQDFHALIVIDAKNKKHEQ